MKQTNKTKRPILHTCPAHDTPEACDFCGQHTTFTYLGEQYWPEKVAARMGISPVVRLWDCSTCKTTVTTTTPLQQ